jgi:dienelactone hydrolase
MTLRRCAAVTLFSVALAVGSVLLCEPVGQQLRALRLVLALAKPPSAVRELDEQDVVLSSPHGAIRARLYRPKDRLRGPGLVLAHGVHYQGIDERRLVPFARALARAGNVVLTPELADVTDYRITLRSVDELEQAVDWLRNRSEMRSPRVGLLGFSFAGGLATVAASRPGMGDKLSFVASVGGHHDLARVLRFLISDRVETPKGPRSVKAHEYGLVVAVYGYVEHFVDSADVAVMRDALRFWLQEDRTAAWARASERTTASAEHLFKQLSEGRLAELGARLEVLFSAHQQELEAVSPRGKLSRIEVPVYLLHGSDDSVIPPSETLWADLELTERQHAALVSPLLGHVEVSRDAAFSDEIALVSFMAQLL